MPRILVAAAITGIVVSTAACGGNSGPSANPSPSASSASASPSPSAAPTPTASANDAADTTRICGQIEKALNTDMRSFGEELGKMLAHKQAGDTRLANKAKAAAQAELKTFATRMRQQAAAAQDPEFRAALQESATNITASAADERFFANLKTLKDVDSLVQKEATTWLMPLAEFCAP